MVTAMTHNQEKFDFILLLLLTKLNRGERGACLLEIIVYAS